MPRLACSPLIMAVVMLLGCSSEGVPSRTVEDVSVRVYSDPTPPRIDPYRIEEGTIFGSGQGKDTYLLVNPSPHVLLEDGTLYILDARVTRAHRFSREGAYLGSFGRQGQGPGEFFVLQDLVYDEGRLYTNDPFNRRITVMDLEGKMLESRQFPDATPRSRFVIPYHFAKGRGYLLIEKEIRQPNRAGEEPKARFTILRLDADLAVTDTLHTRTDTFEVLWINERPVTAPFASVIPATDMAPGQPIAWAYGNEFRVDFLDPEDGSRWAVVIPHQPLPLSEARRQAEIASLSRRTGSEAAANRISFPPNLPHIDSIEDLRWDSEGRLWVPEYRDHTATGSPYRYFVFARDGEWLFRQDLNRRPWLITRAGFYTRSEDEAGNPIVRFYRFVE
jgi:hypothetical protein